MAKRSTWEGDSIAQRFRCPASARLPQQALEQLQMALDLRRDLVRVEWDHDEQRAAVWAQHPAVQKAQESLDDALAIQTEVKALAKQERITDQTTVARSGTSDRLKDSRKEVATARTLLKQAREEAGPDVTDALDAIEAGRHEARKEARAQAVEQGLFGTTGTAVLDAHIVACQRVLSLRRNGKPAERKMPRFDSNGTLTTQIRRNAGMPGRTAKLFGSGEGPYRFIVQITPYLSEADWPRRASGKFKEVRGQITLRVAGAHEDPIILPIFMSRPIPDDAEITDVTITRRFIGGKPRLSVSLKLRVPKPAPKKTGATVAVRMGWASMDSWIRVATIATADGKYLPPPPSDVADLVRANDTTMEVFASPEWRKLLDRDDDIRRQRDQMLDAIKAEVVAAFEAEPKLAQQMAEELDRERLDIARWRSAGRMARLTRAWPQDHPLALHLEAWRRHDMRLWQFEANERDQVTARRRDAYRKLAAWICDHAKVLVLSGVDIAQVTRVPGLGTEDTEAARAARANRQWAAPGDLRACLANAAQRRGVAVIYSHEEAA